MANEPSRLSTVPSALPAEGDYDAICAAVLKTARGRWFLEEYARRNRNADTNRVLGAIERIEEVIRSERSQYVQQSLRVELLEMARTIAESRSEMADIGPELGSDTRAASGSKAASDIFAAAERLQDLASTMRERGLDTAICGHIETLGWAILSASSLRDPSDRRAQKLGEVLRYLERRIDGMLAATAEGAQARPEDTPEAGVELAKTLSDTAGDAPVERAPDLAAEVAHAAAAAPTRMEEPAPLPSASEPAPAPAAPDDDLPRESAATSAMPMPGSAAPPMPAAADALSSEAPQANKTSEREPADFLLEPLPPSAGTEAVERPHPTTAPDSLPSPPESMAELEEELFAAPAAVPAAPIPASESPRAGPNHQPSASQPSLRDPLAALNALTDEERIALFT